MKTILCFGDSNTWGYIPSSGERYPLESRWTGILQRLVGKHARIIEEGLNGRTTVWNEPFRPGRNGKKALVPILESHAPVDLLVIMLGTNDLKHFYNATAFDSARGASALITAANGSRTGVNHSHPDILLIAPPVITTLSDAMSLHFSGAPKKSQQFADAYFLVSQEHDCYYLDAGKVVASSAVDGVHLDSDSHSRLAAAIADKVCQIFSTMPGTG